MRAFCFKHNKITLGFRDYGGKGLTDYYQLKCGCRIKCKDIDKHRIIQKTRYFLKDGREIIRFPKEKIVRYIIKEKKK